MNKILIEEDSIDFKGNSSYIIEENTSKIINIMENSNIKFTIINEEDKMINYIFNMCDNSTLTINIFDAGTNINRNIKVNINGNNSYVLLNISSISLNENNYNIEIYHNCKNTISKANIHGLTINNNSINIVNNGYIKNGSTNSNLYQDNKIIIMNENKSSIKPNLFIDEYDALAYHGAYIGKFDEEELFYLNSRGLDEISSYRLLIHGFLLNDFDIDDNIKEKLENIIKKYWR